MNDYTMGYNAGLELAAHTLRGGCLRKDVTLAEMADHMDMLQVKERNGSTGVQNLGDGAGDESATPEAPRDGTKAGTPATKPARGTDTPLTDNFLRGHPWDSSALASLTKTFERELAEKSLSLSEAVSERDAAVASYRQLREDNLTVIDCGGIKEDILSPLNTCKLRERCYGAIELIECERNRALMDAEHHFQPQIDQGIRDLNEVTAYAGQLQAAAERMVRTYQDWLAGCANETRWKEVEAAHINLRDALAKNTADICVKCGKPVTVGDGKTQSDWGDAPRCHPSCVVRDEVRNGLDVADTIEGAALSKNTQDPRSGTHPGLWPKPELPGVVNESGGWKLVPVTPTVPMLHALGDLRAKGQWEWKNQEAWAAMLAAAPEGNSQGSER